MFIYFWDRETECKQRRGRERGRHRVRRRLQARSCQHRARRGARTPEPWDRDLSRSLILNQLSPPGAPFILLFKFIYLERETERASRGGAEREGGRESQAGSELLVQSPLQGSVSRAGCLTLTNWATQVPLPTLFYFEKLQAWEKLQK